MKRELRALPMQSSKICLTHQRKRGPNGTTEIVAPNLRHPLTATVNHLTKWAPRRLTYCMETKGMPYVDSNFLAKGMQLDRTFKRAWSCTKSV